MKFNPYPFVRRKNIKTGMTAEYWQVGFNLKVEGTDQTRWKYSTGIEVKRKKDGSVHPTREVLLKMPDNEQEALGIIKKLGKTVKKRENKTIPTDVKGYAKYYLERKPTPKDIKTRKGRINGFVRFILEDKNYEMQDVDSGIGENYMRFLYNKVESGVIENGTYNAHIRYVRTMFNCAIKNKICDFNPFSNFTELEGGQRLRVLSEREQSILLEYCQPWVADMVEDALWLGLRISELVNLKFNYLEGNIINYPVRETKSGNKAITQGKKMPKERLIGVPEHILKKWNSQTLRDLHGYIYHDGQGKAPVNTRHLQEQFTMAWSRVFPKLARQQKGLPIPLLHLVNKLTDTPSKIKKKGPAYCSLYHYNKIWREIKKEIKDNYMDDIKTRTFCEKLTFHHLRHTSATRDADANASESMMMQKFGWSSPIMVERYVKSSTDRAMEMVRLREKKINGNFTKLW